MFHSETTHWCQSVSRCVIRVIIVSQRIVRQNRRTRLVGYNLSTRSVKPCRKLFVRNTCRSVFILNINPQIIYCDAAPGSPSLSFVTSTQHRTTTPRRVHKLHSVATFHTNTVRTHPTVVPYCAYSAHIYKAHSTTNLHCDTLAVRYSA